MVAKVILGDDMAFDFDMLIYKVHEYYRQYSYSNDCVTLLCLGASYEHGNAVASGRIVLAGLD